MPTEIKSSTTDDLRLRNYRTQIQNQHESELREMQHKHSDDVQRTMENQSQQLDTLKKAYEVQFSQEAEALEENLHHVRMANEQKVHDEEKAGETELNKLKSANRQRIEEYRKNAEAQLDAVRKQYQTSTDTLQAKAKKSNRDREVS